jgi:putative ABC transport system substrate-binding protein
LALTFPVEAQQPAKVPRIGYLTGGAPAALSARINAFREGLRDLGYAEGKNIIIEWRYAEGKPERLPALAAELVRLKVDVIVTGGEAATRPAREATSTIPIVMTQGADPVGTGFVTSLARPGGNITGMSRIAPELSAKRLEILKEVVPKLSRVAIFGTSTDPSYVQTSKEITLAAGALGLMLQQIEVLGPKDIEPAFRAARNGRAEALLMMISGPAVGSFRRDEIPQLTIKNQLPTMFPRAEYVEAGGLMTYSVSFNDLDRRAATYVDKILKGAKPAELPVEQASKFELVINLKTAKQIGLTIPPNVLARADRVIR